jgi:hypothetical protein
VGGRRLELEEEAQHLGDREDDLPEITIVPLEPALVFGDEPLCWSGWLF